MSWPGEGEKMRLEVTDYDVYDGNNDGIFEPGDHVIVTNITVRNTCALPFYRCPAVRVMVSDDCPLLHPVNSLQLPSAIPPRRSITLEGALVALITDDHNNSRRPNEKLFHKDVPVELVARMNILDELYPEDWGMRKVHRIDIRYPLELDPPDYLRSMAIGETYKLTWRVRNVSQKPQGLNTLRARHVRTGLTGQYSCPGLGEGNPHSEVREFPYIAPGEAIEIDQEITIDRTEDPFYQRNLDLVLLLSNPDSTQQRSHAVITHKVKFQICQRYQRARDSMFLLVINSDSKRSSIICIQDYITKVLKFEVDIFNISLEGSFQDASTGKSIFAPYEGKSIIFLANKFTDSTGTECEISTLLDPWEITRLARLGTSILFLEVAASPEWLAFGSALAFPAPSSAVESSTNAANLSGLITELEPGRRSALGPEQRPLYHQYQSSRLHCMDTKCARISAAKMARRDAARLRIEYPLRRFGLSFDPARHDVMQEKTTIHVFEGLPFSEYVQLSSEPIEQAELPDHHAYRIISTLPIAIQVNVLWNFAAGWGSTNTSPEAMRTTNPQGFRQGLAQYRSDEKNVKFMRLLHASYTKRVIIELREFCAASLRSPLTSATVLSHIPSLSALLKVDLPPLFLYPSACPTILDKLFGTVFAALELFSVHHRFMAIAVRGQSRKSQIRKVLFASLQSKLSALFGATAANRRLEFIKDRSTALVKRANEGKHPEQELHSMLGKMFFELTQNDWAVESDLVPRSFENLVLSRDDLRDRRAVHADWVARVERHEEQAKALFEKHILRRDDG